MGRFFISNNEEKRSIDLYLNKETGFHSKQTKTITKTTIDVYKKRNIEHENVFTLDDDHFIFGTGTYIYKGSKGRSALKGILEDFKKGIPFLQDHVIGQFAIGIKWGSELYLFTDKYNVYEVFYQIDNSGIWSVSNAFYNLAQSSGSQTVIREKFLEEVFQVGIMGEETFLKGIKKLMGYQYMLISNNSLTIKDNRYKKEDQNFSSFEDCVSIYKDKVIAVFNEIKSAFGDDIVLDMTGGFDSRAIFSSFNSVGCNVRLAYGIGNTNITNTKEEDLNIVKKFAVKYNRDLHLMNWEHNYEFNKHYLERQLKQYGIHYKIYGANSNYFKEYECRDPYPGLFVNGDFGENLKAREWLEELPLNSVTLKKIIKDYHLPLPVNKNTFTKKEYYEKYTSYLYDQLSKLVKKYDIRTEGGKISKDNFDELRQIFARSMDNKLVNFRNEFSYSLVPFGTTQLYEYMFNVPYEYRRNSRFQMALIKELDESVMEIPIFSHTKEFKESKFNAKKYIKGLLRSKMDNFYQYYYSFKHKNKETSKIEEDYRNYLETSPIVTKFLDVSSLFTERLVVRVALYTLLLENINADTIEEASKDTQ
jgi:hypothetical protein